jgi:SEC-C motif-containing protein
MKDPCFCGSLKAYDQCCGPYHSGQSAPTPEALMRSRYSAYALANIDYIEKTMKGPALENFKVSDAKAWAQSVKWSSLKVIKTSKHESDPNIGYVNFCAKYKAQGRMHKLEEHSEFHREQGCWFYTRAI